ncbi:MAG: toll/interleukin-1 receptor domain-containing protein [Armatimonadetes bacterium]|nr:toll/interleukin-1 receptor domain-containing protein [Anaerolineae bacterium]
MTDHDHDALFDELPDEPEDIEAYCVRCRESVTMEAPQAVWTRKGMPATRGICPICGGTVFRMGATDAHRKSARPTPVAVGDGDRRKAPTLTRDTVYINYAASEAEFAQSLAADLNNAGIAAWLAEPDPGEVAWAGGVHPALQECARMVLVLSPDALQDTQVAAGWQFFRGKRKPIVIAQLSTAAAPPDDIRRSPRFDFAADYKSAFRQMLQALSS